MKRGLSILGFLLLLNGIALGQGLVNFANASSISGWVNPFTDRHVVWDDLLGPVPPGPNLVSSNSFGVDLSSLRAALYYAASTDFDPLFNGFVAASGGSATFRSSTSAYAGYWFGHTDTLDNIPSGTTANLVVFVWDSSLTGDPLSSAAKSGIWGHSAIFQYTPSTASQPQSPDLMMNNLMGFGVKWVPEPSVFACAGIGIILLIGGRKMLSKLHSREAATSSSKLKRRSVHVQTIALLALCLGAANSSGQELVYFGNASSLGWANPISRPFRPQDYCGDAYHPGC